MTSNRLKMSVLMPVYKHEQFVEFALNSILESDCNLIELIVCDDASPDRSATFARTWIEHHAHRFHRAVFIENKKNQGITRTLNQLLEMATSDCATLIASDDAFPAKAIERQLDYFERHPNCDFLFSDCEIMDNQNNIIAQHSISRFNAFFLHLKSMIMLQTMFNWSIVWARMTGRLSAIRALGKYIEGDAIEDRWGAIKILNTSRFSYLHQVCFTYRYRGIGMHPNPETIQIQKARKIFHRIERDLHPETRGLLNLCLWARRLPFKTNYGVWPCRGLPR